MKNPKIVTIGGGTGQFTVLSGLKKFNGNLTAIVNMVDDGGSTGVLRDELGVLPPGDVRQCLVALSHSSKSMRDLFNYRFENGSFGGHNFGNLLLTALEKTTGSFEKAINEVSNILAISGSVIPVTTDDTHLCLKLKNGKVISGQYKIENSFFSQNKGFIKLFLSPKAKINPRAKKAILESDVLIIGPGSFYTSIIPNILVRGMSEAIKKSKALKIYICNLVNKPGQTDNFEVCDYIDMIEDFVGKPIFDYVVFNNKKPSQRILARYEEVGENLVWFTESDFTKKHYKTISSDLISKKAPKKLPQDKLKRTLIRHNSERIARLILDIYEREL